MYKIGCDNLRELVAYAIIFGFSQDNESTFNGSLSHVESALMCSRHTAIDVLKSLEDKGLIVKEQYVINSIKHNRYSVFAPVVQKLHYGSAEIAPNNKIDNNIPPTTLFPIENKDSVPQWGTSKRFVKPSIEDIVQYCKTKGITLDAEKFYYYYESKGWVVGKSPMKNWKAAIQTWLRQEAEKEEMENKPYIED